MLGEFFLSNSDFILTPISWAELCLCYKAFLRILVYINIMILLKEWHWTPAVGNSLATMAFLLSSVGLEPSACSAFGREAKGLVLLLSIATWWEDLEEAELDSFWEHTGKRLRHNGQKLKERILQLDTRINLPWNSGSQGFWNLCPWRHSELSWTALQWARWVNQMCSRGPFQP